MALRADVTDPAAVGSMVDAALGRFGRLDILVNNAALRREAAFGEIALADWREVLGIILDGAFVCAQACVPPMIRAGGGAIVNIGGLTAHTGARRRAHVVTAKAGLVGMTKALAHDLAPHGIIVNCVVAGPDRHGARLGARPRIMPSGPTLSAGWAAPTRSRPRCACCAARARATSPARRCTSTAAPILGEKDFLAAKLSREAFAQSGIGDLS